MLKSTVPAQLWEFNIAFSTASTTPHGVKLHDLREYLFVETQEKIELRNIFSATEL
jgi:hypothetical protein